MNQDWQTFLRSQGAEIEQGTTRFKPVREEIAHAANDTVVIPLTQLGVIRSHGEDSTAFLQGQTSNDLQALDERHSQLSAYCNPKGRMLAQFRLLPVADNDYLLVLHRALMDSTLKRLRMFVLRSKVTLDDVSDELVALGLAGARAEALIAEQFANPPAGADELVREDGVSTVRLADGQGPRFLILAAPAQAERLWQAWSAQATAVGSRAWEWLDIRAGLPQVVPATVEEFVPLMVNLQHLNGVSFNKGCYPGQEIIARTHYLGKIKRRMYRAHSPVEAPPEPGTDIYDANAGEQSVGKVVNAQPGPEGGVDLLAVLQVSAEQATLQVGEARAPLQLQSLPYSLEQAS